MVSIRRFETFLLSFEWLFFQWVFVLVFLLFESALKNSFKRYYFWYYKHGMTESWYFNVKYVIGIT